MKTKIMRNKFKILTILLTGGLLGLMAAMMWAGGSMSFGDFLQAGNIYEWSQKELQISNEKWVYQEEASCFQIAAPKAKRVFLIDNKENTWNYFYADVDKLSVESLPAELLYYDRAGKLLYRQPIVLTQGENLIGLNPGIPIHRLGIYLENAQGVSLSFASMQVRQKFTGYSRITTVLVAAGTFLIFCLFCLLVWKYKGKQKKQENKAAALFFELYDYLFTHFGNNMSRKIGEKQENDRSSLQRLLFSLLFLWSIVGNVWGITVGINYRYHLLICTVLLVLLGLSCKKEREKKVKWNTPIAWAWLFLWAGICISDFAVIRQSQFQGYVMLFAAGFFIYRWNRMKNPLQIFGIIMEALEIVFFESIAICLLFRPKLPAVQYNGIFKNPEDSAMFALLMLVVFGIQLEQSVFGAKRRMRIFSSISGMGLAAYLVLRAENRTGYVIMALLLLIFAYRFFACRRNWYRWFQENHKKILISTAAALVLVVGFYAGTKVLPQKLGLSWEYKNEVKMSQKPEETLTELENAFPGYTKDIVREADLEKSVIQKHYFRRMNLLGNTGTVQVFRKNAQAYNGYLYMAYRYGIFILVPYIMYQLIALWISADCLRKGGKNGKRKTIPKEEQIKLWQLSMFVIYIGFNLWGNAGNAELLLGHPLWLCIYLGFGCCFENDRIKVSKTTWNYS